MATTARVAEADVILDVQTGSKRGLFEFLATEAARGAEGADRLRAAGTRRIRSALTRPVRADRGRCGAGQPDHAEPRAGSDQRAGEVPP